MFAISNTAEHGLEQLKNLAKAFNPEVLDARVGPLAASILVRAVKMTPKKWSGSTRAGWEMRRNGPGDYMVFNERAMPVIAWLDKGTQAHGPVRAKALFIPLTQRAALANVEGMRQERLGLGNPWGHRKISLLRYRNKRGGGYQRYTLNLIYGVDYILAKWVRGIQPLNITGQLQVAANKELREVCVVLYRDAINGNL